MRGNGLTTGLQDLIETLPENIEMVEIGSFLGESTKIFLDSGKIKFLHSIDPFDFSVDDAGGFGPKFGVDNIRETFYANVVENEKYKGKIMHHELNSSDAVSLFDDGFIDLVYIDGNHDKNFVIQDIKSWEPKIKIGGYISGHDWQNWMVHQAVNETIGEPDRLFTDGSWIKKKTGS